jgi:hypothetical protein
LEFRERYGDEEIFAYPLGYTLRHVYNRAPYLADDNIFQGDEDDVAAFIAEKAEKANAKAKGKAKVATISKTKIKSAATVSDSADDDDDAMDGRTARANKRSQLKDDSAPKKAKYKERAIDEPQDIGEDMEGVEVTPTPDLSALAAPSGDPAAAASSDDIVPRFSQVSLAPSSLTTLTPSDTHDEDFGLRSPFALPTPRGPAEFPDIDQLDLTDNSMHHIGKYIYYIIPAI